MKIQLMKKELFSTINKPQLSHQFKRMFKLFYKKEFLLYSCLHEPLKTVKILEWTKSQYAISSGGTSDI